jgi:hypothetical protein
MTPDEVRDRRSRPRLNLSCSIRVYRPGGADAVATRTEDISCQGFYFTSEQPFAPREKLECELVIQGEALGCHAEIDVFLRGRAEVVRVVPKGLPEGFGVACRLEDYTVHQQAPADSRLEETLVGTWRYQAWRGLSTR